MLRRRSITGKRVNVFTLGKRTCVGGLRGSGSKVFLVSLGRGCTPVGIDRGSHLSVFKGILKGSSTSTVAKRYQWGYGAFLSSALFFVVAVEGCL